MRYELDYFPLVVMHVDPTDDHDGAIVRLLDSATKVLQMHQKYTCVIHAHVAMGAKQRALYAQWEKDNAALLAQYYLGAGFVLRSTLVRGAMTALRWIAPAAQPELITQSARDATQFCLRLLANAGVTDVEGPQRYLALVNRVSTARRSGKHAPYERPRRP